MSGLVDIVKRVKKLNLRALLAGNELNIVHKEEINIAMFVSKFFGFSFFDGLHHLVGKIVAFDVGNLLFREAFFDGMADGPQQMGLTETGISVDKKGIVVFSRIFRNRNCGGVGELIGVADDKVVKGVACHLLEGPVFPDSLFLLVFFIPSEN